MLGGGGGSVAFEGFVLYAGGDYTLYPNIMLLVQVMAYVMSGTLAPTGDVGTIPAGSRAHGGRTSPTGDVDTLPAES